MTLPVPTTFRFSLDDGVATITLDNQRTLNSLTFESYAELRDFLPALSSDDAVRAVVVTGSGKGFCSGGDRNASSPSSFVRRAQAAGVHA
jgi:enoyl-CoA hydratase/carnithine racemase